MNATTRNPDVANLAPVVYPRTVRPDVCRVMTSHATGDIVPIWYVPVLRGDRASGKIRVVVKMDETEQKLENGIHYTVRAHFVPFLASDRFRGLDDLDRAYNKVPEGEGLDPIPMFEEVAFDEAAPFYRAMGMHSNQATVNGWPVEAYNLLVNAQYRRRSAKLPQREVTDTTLAPCFWKGSRPSMWCKLGGLRSWSGGLS